MIQSMAIMCKDNKFREKHCSACSWAPIKDEKTPLTFCIKQYPHQQAAFKDGWSRLDGEDGTAWICPKCTSALKTYFLNFD